MGVSSLRRHKAEWEAKGIVPKSTTIQDVVGEPMHSSGLTLREYNEIVKDVSKMSDKDISLEETENDIKKWEEESPAVKEDDNGKEANEEREEESQGREEESIVVTPYVPTIETLDSAVIEEALGTKVIKKKRVYKRKVV